MQQTRKVVYKFLMTFLMAVLPFIGYSQYTTMNLPTYDYQQWHFGFTLGFNSMNFMAIPVSQDDIDKELRILQPQAGQGFNIGIVANKRLAEFIDLRFIPTLSFGERQVTYVFQQDTIRRTYIKTIESTFLDFPLEIKYKGKRLPNNMKNIRPYVLAGLRYSIDLSSQKNKKNNNAEVVLKLKSQDVLFDLGVGFDFYLKYFKFGIELKMAYGMLNMLVDENNPFTTNTDSLHSKIMWFSFTFE